MNKSKYTYTKDTFTSSLLRVYLMYICIQNVLKVKNVLQVLKLTIHYK